MKLNQRLIDEWHPTKNGDLRPGDVSHGSGKKVYWLCSKGHEWRTTVNSRTTGCGCPYCKGKVACLDNCLATKNPALATEWHPTKNKLTPYDVTPGSRKEVWWSCTAGHEWESPVFSRSSKGNRCPQCYQGLPCVTTNSKLVGEWHPDRNGDLRPENVTLGSSKKVIWRCENNHEWEASIAMRNRGTGCPYCNGRFRRPVTPAHRLANYPTLLREWDYEKNGDLTPYDVTPGSGKVVWWLCDAGHSYRSRILGRTDQSRRSGLGRGCPRCRSDHRICLVSRNEFEIWV